MDPPRSPAIPLLRPHAARRLAALRAAVRAGLRVARAARARGGIARADADGVPRRGPRRAAARSRPRAGRPTTRPPAATGPGPASREALARFCADRAERLAATLATRRTQTNEVARCGWLLPAFAAVADGRPLALIEIGASAGLNLRWDHYAYDYGGPGRRGSLVAADDRMRAGGPHVPPLDPPPVAWRAGIDLAPVDASDPADARWLRACLWPDQPARQARLAAALAIAREHPVEIRRGDALALLPGLIAEAPADALVCVFHTAVLIYFAPEQIDALARCSGRSSATSPGSAGEAPGVLVEDRRAERGAAALRARRRAGPARSSSAAAWATTAAGWSGSRSRGSCAGSGRGRRRARSASA